MLDNGSFDIHLFGTGGHGVSHKFLNEEHRQYRFSRCKRNNFDENKPEVILMQFTCRKMNDTGRKIDDINIYEGDVIDYGGWRDVVKWNEKTSGFGLWNTERKKWDSNTIPSLEGRAIFHRGNIYENPELLK